MFVEKLYRFLLIFGSCVLASMATAQTSIDSCADRDGSICLQELTIAAGSDSGTENKKQKGESDKKRDQDNSSEEDCD